MLACKLCQRQLPQRALMEFRDMPAVAQNFPDAGSLAEDRGVAFGVRECVGCGLVQLDCPPVPYHRDVIRAAGISPGMGEFRRAQFAQFVGEHGLLGRTVLEVGCGRGEYLFLMKEAGARVAGIEHAADSVEVCRRQGLDVACGYIESEDFPVPGAPFDGFFTLNFLEHVPELNVFLRGIAHNLLPGGIGLVEVPNFNMMIRERLLSEFMTDHLTYFTTETLSLALRLNGFDVLSCREIWHDYIVSAVVRKREPLGAALFLERRELIRNQLDSFLAKYPERSVVVWGAGHQALASISLFHLRDRIAYVVDSAPFKQGRFTPASHLPVKAPEAMKLDCGVRAVLIMGAGYSDEITGIVRRDFGLPHAIVRPHGLETGEGK